RMKDHFPNPLSRFERGVRAGATLGEGGEGSVAVSIAKFIRASQGERLSMGCSKAEKACPNNNNAKETGSKKQRDKRL
ncbi:MAG: hypothetical protein Q6K70_11260, partial [Thermostichales cyanobacterium DRC_bins_46]